MSSSLRLAAVLWMAFCYSLLLIELACFGSCRTVCGTLSSPHRPCTLLWQCCACVPHSTPATCVCRMQLLPHNCMQVIIRACTGDSKRPIIVDINNLQQQIYVYGEMHWEGDIKIINSYPSPRRGGLFPLISIMSVEENGTIWLKVGGSSHLALRYSTAGQQQQGWQSSLQNKGSAAHSSRTRRQHAWRLLMGHS